MGKKPYAIELKIDFRERTGDHRRLIGRLPACFSIHYMTLPVGDYVIDNQVIIERKTVDDFRESVKDGRMFRQAYRLASCRQAGVFVIEGDPFIAGKHRLDRHVWLGVIVHISVMLGIPVLFTAGYEETLFLFESIVRQLDSLTKKGSRIYAGKPFKKGFSAKERIQLAMLQSIPGLGTEKALSLLRVFGSIQKIVLAEENELRGVKGIGKMIGRNLVQVFMEDKRV